MSEYRSKQTLSSTSPVAFWGAAPARPCKLSTLKQLSVFSSFSMHLGFDSKMNQLFGRTNTTLSKGTVEEEFERYMSGLPIPREMDIIHFWEVSFPIPSKMNAANPDNTDQSEQISNVICDCYRQSTNLGIVCSLQTYILISKKDWHVEVQLNEPDDDGGFANIEVLAQERPTVYQLYQRMEDSEGWDDGGTKDY